MRPDKASPTSFALIFSYTSRSPLSRASEVPKAELPFKSEIRASKIFPDGLFDMFVKTLTEMTCRPSTAGNNQRVLQSPPLCDPWQISLPCRKSALESVMNMEGLSLARTAVLAIVSGETGLTRYPEQIRRFPMLEPQEEFMLAKRWREHGDRDAAHKLVTSHLRLVAKVAMRYRGYGLPIAEVISEGNVGLVLAVKRFEPDKGFRLTTYAMWWIRAAIQEYILRSWSLVKMGTTANQKKLFFNLRRTKSRISALEEGDMRPDQVKLIVKRLGVAEQDVIDMNRRLGGDASLNVPIREDGDSGEWMDWLVDDSASQESRLAESEQSDNRHKALGEALTVLDDRERRIFEARRLADDPITLEELAGEFDVSRERIRQIEVRPSKNIARMEKPAADAAMRSRRIDQATRISSSDLAMV
jgi:RNA polymerase sigma-32 factor